MAKEDFYGKVITGAKVHDGGLYLMFSDGTSATVYDDAQHCCEHRYITCDDDPEALVGGELLSIEEKEGGEPEADYHDMCHDTMFVEVQSSKGLVTLTTHNEHNGYYGGFSVRIK